MKRTAKIRRIYVSFALIAVSGALYVCGLEWKACSRSCLICTICYKWLRLGSYDIEDRNVSKHQTENVERNIIFVICRFLSSSSSIFFFVASPSTIFRCYLCWLIFTLFLSTTNPWFCMIWFISIFITNNNFLNFILLSLIVWQRYLCGYVVSVYSVHLYSVLWLCQSHLTASAIHLKCAHWIQFTASNNPKQRDLGHTHTHTHHPPPSLPPIKTSKMHKTTTTTIAIILKSLHWCLNSICAWIWRGEELQLRSCSTWLTIRRWL